MCVCVLLRAAWHGKMHAHMRSHIPGPVPCARTCTLLTCRIPIIHTPPHTATQHNATHHNALQYNAPQHRCTPIVKGMGFKPISMPASPAAAAKQPVGAAQ